MIRMLIISAAFTACSPTQRENNAQRARNAADLAAYTHALEDCRKEGRAAKSYDVYEACAIRADAKYGFDGGAK